MEKFRFTEFLLELQAEGARKMLKQHVSIFESYFDYIFLQILELFFCFQHLSVKYILSNS